MYNEQGPVYEATECESPGCSSVSFFFLPVYSRECYADIKDQHCCRNGIKIMNCHDPVHNITQIQETFSGGLLQEVNHQVSRRQVNCRRGFMRDDVTL